MLSIRKTISGRLPDIPFEKIARAILGAPRRRRGAPYDLSLVVCGDYLAAKINKIHRGKTYPSNVLSFPVSKNEGEIFLNARKAAREAKRFGIALDDRLAHLFVHGCYHLKGLDHSERMDRLEKKTLERFGFET